MVAPVYRYLAYDLRTNVLLEELPLRNVSFGYRLNGTGSFTAELPLGLRSAAGTKLSSYHMIATRPVHTALYVERDGVLVWGGVIWGRDRKKSALSATIAGQDWFSYLSRRVLRTRKQYVAATDDQFDIAEDLIGWLQLQAGGDISLQVVRTPSDSGVTRDRTYEDWERKNIGEAIVQLAEVIDGFDFAATSTYDNGVPARRLELNYPRRGRTVDETNIVFETGKNVVDYEWPEDGARTANAIDAIGAGEGIDMLIQTAVRTDLIDLGYPLLDDVVTYKDVKIEGTLYGHALSAVDARAAPVTTGKLTVRVDVSPLLGSWIVGDDARLRIEDDELFPEGEGGALGLDTILRIVDANVFPDSVQGEIAVLTFAERPTIL